MLRTRNQRGAVLILAAFLLVVIFAIGALIIDLLRVQRASRTLQRAADAAALAGASQLRRTIDTTNGTIDDWKRSKRAVFAALRSNPVFGDFGEILNSGEFGIEGGSPPRGYPPDVTYEDPDSHYAYSAYDYPNLDVDIERLFYYRATDTTSIRELVLEGRDWCGNPSPPPELMVPISNCCLASTPTFQVANAVRVTLTLKRLPLFFGRFVGLESLTTLSRTALGTAEILPPGNFEDCIP